MSKYRLATEKEIDDVLNCQFAIQLHTGILRWVRERFGEPGVETGEPHYVGVETEMESDDEGGGYARISALYVYDIHDNLLAYDIRLPFWRDTYFTEENFGTSVPSMGKLAEYDPSRENYEDFDTNEDALLEHDTNYYAGRDEAYMDKSNLPDSREYSNFPGTIYLLDPVKVPYELYIKEGE